MKYSIIKNNSESERIVLELRKTEEGWQWYCDEDDAFVDPAFCSKKKAMDGAKLMWPGNSVWKGEFVR
jgi:hypothetical protein